MENIFFPSKSSFAVFVWLTLCLVSVLSIGSADKLHTTLAETVDHSLTRLLNIQNSLLPRVTETLDAVVELVEPVSFMRVAQADETDEVDAEALAGPYLAKADFSPTPVAESEPAAIPKNDLQCMAENIYYEAGGQSYAGKIAVGLVVLNRLKLPSYPNTICGVIYEGSRSAACQFSWTCNKRNPISKNSDNWMQSLRAATELLNGKNKVDIVEGATNFHASSVKPSWAKRLKFVARIDEHLFYKGTSQ